MKDENGTEIHTGDIVEGVVNNNIPDEMGRYGPWNATMERVVVKFKKGFFNIAVMPVVGKWKVVGNIYDNPELL